MIEIDGSRGHGGGQIIRTAVALSAITGKQFKMDNIRVGRPSPGLKPQHLHGVRAAAELCNASIRGDEQGSTWLEFEPGEIERKNLKVDTGTAGSVSLVLQTLLPPCFHAGASVEVIGGTDVKWSPPIDYLSSVTLPLLAKLGLKAECRVERRGYYPKGGGAVKALVQRGEPRPVKLVEKGKLIAVKGVSHASKSLEEARVAERQAAAARKELAFLGVKPEMRVEYCDTPSPGSGIQLWSQTENSVLGGNALGERGKPAEEVGREAAKQLLGQYERGVVDKWSADQLIPYMALAGKSEIHATEVTEHCRTNIGVVQEFTNQKFIVNDRVIRVR